jgi:hypothetical protein
MPTSFRARLRRKRALVEEFRSSGLSQTAFCRLKKVPVSTFHWWLRKIRNEKAPDSTSGRPLFIPLPTGAASPAIDRFELYFADGRRLMLPASIAMDDVVHLIRESAIVS